MEQEFIIECDELANAVRNALEKILLSQDRTSKHKPYSWASEDINEHLLKAMRHINTHLLIREGYQKPDGEYHLANAATRLAMAMAEIDRGNN